RTVELMGGTVGVESREGSGSTFWFTVRFPRSPQSDSRQAMPVPMMRGRVLVVDDTATQRRVLALQLECFGLEVSSAESAPVALAMLREAQIAKRPFSLALVDHRMPDIDGAQLCGSINASPELQATRLVLLTSSRAREEVFASLGIAACLPKPVT